MTSKRIKVKIKELGKVVGGATPSTRNPENWGGSIPWVTPKDLANHRERFIKKGEKSISQKGYDSCSTKMLPKGTVLFSSRAPIGYCAIAENDICTNQGFKSIIPNENTDSLFLYYLLKSNVDAIANNASGTTFLEISGKAMEEIEVAIPEDKNEQRQIAQILDAFDKKIENNLKLNDYLAETADSLFINTFGHLKENAVLSDIANITMGQSPTGASYNNVGNGAVFYQGRGEFGWRFPTRRLFTTEPKRMAKAGDILMSVRAPVGDLNIAYEDCCIGRGLAGINCSYPSFCLYLMRSLCKKLNAYNSEGTVFGSINSKDLKNIEIALPNVDDIISFEDKVVPIDNLIKFNEIENRNLSQLRDILLSKLMSGKIHAGY